MRKQAFTLIEAMVVVAIIAIAVAVGASSYRSYSAKSKWGEVQGCIADVALRMENYRSNHGVYPVDDVWTNLNTTNDCNNSKWYRGEAAGLNDGANYIIAFSDSNHKIWGGDRNDIWIMVDSSPNIIHYQDPVEGKDEALPSGYTYPIE